MPGDDEYLTGKELILACLVALGISALGIVFGVGVLWLLHPTRP